MPRFTESPLQFTLINQLTDLFYNLSLLYNIWRREHAAGERKFSMQGGTFQFQLILSQWLFILNNSAYLPQGCDKFTDSGPVTIGIIQAKNIINFINAFFL